MDFGGNGSIEETKLTFRIDFTNKYLATFLKRLDSSTPSLSHFSVGVKNTVVLEGIETIIMGSAPELCYEKRWIPFYYRNLLFKPLDKRHMSPQLKYLSIRQEMVKDYLKGNLQHPEIILGPDTRSLNVY